MITQDEFERAYAERSGMTIDEFRAWLIGLPCACGEETCEGWFAVSRDPDHIAEYLDFYAPEAPRTMVHNRFGKLGYARSPNPSEAQQKAPPHNAGRA